MRLSTRLLSLLAFCLALTWQPGAALAQASPKEVQKAKSSGKWHQLKADEKKALQPLAARWGELTDTQRSKWLAIAQHFDKLSPAEQQIMQTRMAEWVALNPVQRNQARLNFNTVQTLSKDEKKNRWDEYQSLSEEEKRRLSKRVLTTSKTTAPSPRPVGSDRLVQPAVRTLPSTALPARAPIDQKTLLPLPPPAEPSPPAGTPAVREAPAS